MFNKFYRKLAPIQILSLGFLIIMLLGSLLLALPICSTNGSSQNFLDALFTAVSAVSTTGLIVVDTGTYYSLWGQIIILILIQIGGLGYMIIFVLVLLFVNNKFSIHSKKLLRESFARLPEVNLILFVKQIVLFSLLIELVGTIGYTIYWLNYYPFSEALYYSIFHSVSAFCTAGFSLFSDSLSKFGTSWLININTFILVYLGSIGFFVMHDLVEYIKGIRKKQKYRLSLHSKIAMSTSLSIIIIGTIYLFFIEGNNFSSVLTNKLFYSAFQSITASTTVGFNTVDIGLLSNSSLLLLIILMFIGGSPGGTAGGIKTIAFVVFSKFSLSFVHSDNAVSIFKRTIDYYYFYKSTSLIFIGFISILFFTFCLTITENHEFLKIFFEATSAFGTVGLSMGITADLTALGKISIIALMIIGRLGPLALGLAFLPNTNNKKYLYPKEEVLIT